MSEAPESHTAAHRARREAALRRGGVLLGKVLSLVQLIGGLVVSVVALDHAGGVWTAFCLSSLFFGFALRGLWSLLQLNRRNPRLAVPVAYLTAGVFVLSGLAGVGALLAESVVPAIFLAPAAFGMAVFLAGMGRDLKAERHAA